MTICQNTLKCWNYEYWTVTAAVEHCHTNKSSVHDHSQFSWKHLWALKLNKPLTCYIHQGMFESLTASWAHTLVLFNWQWFHTADKLQLWSLITVYSKEIKRFLGDMELCEQAKVISSRWYWFTHYEVQNKLRNYLAYLRENVSSAL